MNEEAVKYREEIKAIFARLNRGEISYDEAKGLAAEPIDNWNKLNKAKATEIAKKYNMKPRHRDVRFASLIRSPELLW